MYIKSYNNMDPNTVTKVYKYYNSQFADDIENGKIYVNTFENIRNIDEEKQIGDSQEGVSVTNFGEVFLNPDDPEYKAKAEKISPFGIGAKGGKILILGGSSSLHLPNAFMYCVTKDRNDKYWKEKVGYDCCAEITDFIEFSLRLSKTIADNGYKFLDKQKQVLLGPCTYENNGGIIDKEAFEGIRPSYLRKRPSYETQNEVRSVFLLDYVKHKSLTPTVFNIKIDDLAKFHKI